MQIGGNKKRVKLVSDLTKYNSKLKIGQKGYTIPDVQIGSWGGSDRFVAVKFDNGVELDVLWNSIETT